MADSTLMRSTLIVILLTVAAQASQGARSRCFAALSKLPAPVGYRYPVENDVRDDWEFYREEYNDEASCKSADLNGDGVPDYVSFALSTAGPRFAVVILYSGPKGYQPRIVWTDAGQILRPWWGRVHIVEPGRHTGFLGCNELDAIVTLPSRAVEYWDRVPHSIESPGEYAKPEHRLFWSSDKGLTIAQQDLCTAAAWEPLRHRWP